MKTTRYSTYSKYKDSGVQWLGKVPKAWGIISTRFGYSIQLGKMLQPAASSQFDQEISYLKSQHVQWEFVQLNDLPLMWASEMDQVKYSVSDGDLLVCEGGDVGRAGIVRNPPKPLIIQNALHRVKSQTNDLRFLMFLLKHAASQKWFEILCNRSTIAHFTSEKFHALQIPLPTVPEQTAIADFLDRKTGRIDTLVSKKQRLIELLKEKRSALISRCVTRGLPEAAAREFELKPHTHFKDSGVEWLGEVPEGWKIKPTRLGYSIQLGKMLQPEISSLLDQEVPYLKSQHVLWEYVRISELPTMWASKLDVIKYSVRDGDLLVCEGGDVGRAGIIRNPPERTIIQNALHRVRSRNNHLYFLMFTLEHAASQNWFEILCNRSTIAHFTTEKFGALRIPLPLLSEQTAIATYLDRETAKIDCLVEKIETMIDRLQEYRAALITAAVTGKIRVCPLPEEPQLAR